MERKLDIWTWEATLLNREVMREEVFGSIGAVPTHLVYKFALVSKMGRIECEFPTGITRISGFGEDSVVRPGSTDLAVANKVPMFFRRMKLDGSTNETNVLFRVIGFAAYTDDGELLGVRGLRVHDYLMDKVYRSALGPEAARHVTGQLLIIG